MAIDISALNWFDIFVLSVVGISTLFAFFKGFIKTVFSFITWALSVTATLYTYPYASAYFTEHTDNEKVALVLSLMGVFVVYFIIFAVIMSQFMGIFHKLRWGIIDRTLGFGLGVFRGAVVVCIMYYSVAMTTGLLQAQKTEEVKLPDFITKAQTYTMLKEGTDYMLTMVPVEVRDHLTAMVEESFKKMSSALGKDGDLSEGQVASPKTLTTEQRAIMGKIIAAIPPEDIQQLSHKYDSNMVGMSELERMAVFREILVLYKNTALLGKIDEAKKVSDHEVELLSQALSGANAVQQEMPQKVVPEQEMGYKKFNLQQFDRLINTL